MGTDTYEAALMIEKRLIELTQAVDELRRVILGHLLSGREV